VDEVGNNRAAALDPVAVDSLLEMIGDDPEMVREIVDAFLEDAPARLTEIATGLADGDATVVERNWSAVRPAIEALAAGAVR
jgi:HPt (histidine-containing phosphotransfer) domain-containing protein